MNAFCFKCVCAFKSVLTPDQNRTCGTQLEENFSRKPKPLLLIRRSSSSLSGWSKNCVVNFFSLQNFVSVFKTRHRRSLPKALQSNQPNCDMSVNSNLLDKFLDENNNWFNNIDPLSAAMMHGLPEPTFSFKSGLKMHCMDSMDESVMCKFSNGNSQQPPQQQPQQQLTKQSVKRALFVEKDEIDHEANLKLVQKQLDQLLCEDSERWNFDFKNNRPLHNVNSQYEWFVGESVLAKLDLNCSTAAAVDASPMEQPIKSRRPATGSKSQSSAILPDHHTASPSPISNKATGKLSNSNSTNTPISTRSSSHKRKLNIDGTCLSLLILRGLSRPFHLLLIPHTIYPNVLVFTLSSIAVL